MNGNPNDVELAMRALRKQNLAKGFDRTRADPRLYWIQSNRVPPGIGMAS